MRVAVKRIDGVDSVDVSLNEGFARVTFKAANRVTVDQVREVIRRNGFTPKDAETRIEGRVLDQQGRLVLAVPGHDQVYALDDLAGAPGALLRLRREGLNKSVLIEGVMPEARKRGAPAVSIQVRGFRTLTGNDPDRAVDHPRGSTRP